MKIVAISDLHGYLPELPECDIVCICGDIVPLDIQRNTFKSVSWFQLKFRPWAENLKCNKVLFIAGNHDFYLEECYKKNHVYWGIMEDLFLYNTKLYYLCDSTFKYENKIFYGTPWIPDLKKWAFYGNHKELNDKFGLIPSNCDVLLTHCPPKFSTCGTVLQKNVFNTNTDYGCQELKDAIDILHPKWNFCGHVHSGYHGIITLKDTNIVNVSLKDEYYNVAYNPFIIEL